MRSSWGRASRRSPRSAKDDPLYNEQLAKQYTEYDPDTANAMLDALVPNKDGEGYRLDEQGRRLTIIFELDQTRTTFLDMFAARRADVPGGRHRCAGAHAWTARSGRRASAAAASSTRPCHQFGANSGIAAMLDARYFVPFNANSLYAPGWQLYYHRAGQSETRSSRRRRSRPSRSSIATCWRRPIPSSRRRRCCRSSRAPPTSSWSSASACRRTATASSRTTWSTCMKMMPNSFGWPTPGPTRPEQFFKA